MLKLYEIGLDPKVLERQAKRTEEVHRMIKEAHFFGRTPLSKSKPEQPKTTDEVKKTTEVAEEVKEEVKVEEKTEEVKQEETKQEEEMVCEKSIKPVFTIKDDDPAVKIVIPTESTEESTAETVINIKSTTAPETNDQPEVRTEAKVEDTTSETKAKAEQNVETKVDDMKGSCASVNASEKKKDEIALITPLFNLEHLTKPTFTIDRDVGSDNTSINLIKLNKIVDSITSSVGGDTSTRHSIYLTVVTLLYKADGLSVNGITSPFDMITKECSTVGDMEFVNSISKYFTGDVIFSKVNCYEIEETIDGMLLRRILESLDSRIRNDYPDLGDTLLAIRDYLETYRTSKTYRSKKELMSYSMGEETEGYIPTMFVNSNLDLEHNNEVSAQTKAKIEKTFGNMLLQFGFPYALSKINDIIVASVTYPDGNVMGFMIDPNIVYGNGYNLLVMIGNFALPVNLDKHFDLVVKILGNPYYRLTAEEIRLCTDDLFTNGGIYYFIDMSKGKDFLPQLSREDFDKLGRYLTCATNMPWSTAFGISNPRLRFEIFRSVDDFILISDNVCKSSLYGFGSCAENIFEGLRISVNSGNIVMTYKGDVVTRKISETGIM